MKIHLILILDFLIESENYVLHYLLVLVNIKEEVKIRYFFVLDGSHQSIKQTEYQLSFIRTNQDLVYRQKKNPYHLSMPNRQCVYDKNQEEK
jgi:hypothetical protein